MKRGTALLFLTPIASACLYLIGAMAGNIRGAVFGYCLSYLPYLCMVYGLSKNDSISIGRFGISISIALASALLLFTTPILSEDIWRYVWDGFQLRSGIDPYCTPPADPSQDRFSHQLQLETVREQIGHAHLPTIYPPLALSIFSISSFFAPSSLPIRILGVLAIIVCTWLLSKILSRRSNKSVIVVLFAFHPLLLVETAVSGHVDIFALMLLLTAFYLLEKSRDTLGSIALGFAVLTKLIPILAAPLIVRGKLRNLCLFCAVIAALYTLIASFDCSPLGSLSTFSGKWRHNDGLFGVIYWVYTLLLDQWTVTLSVPETISKWTTGETQITSTHELCMLLTKITLGICLLFAIFHLIRKDLFELEKAGFILLVMLLCSPVIHPWYLIWILPLLPFLWFRARLIGTTPLLWWSTIILVAYEARVHSLTEGVWRSTTSFVALEYGIFYFLVAICWLRKNRLFPSADQ